MSFEQITSGPLRHFWHQPGGEFLGKVEAMTGHADELHIVADFDRTQTVRAEGFTRDPSSWQIVAEHLDEDPKAVHDELYDHYIQFEKNNTMTTELAEEWWGKALKLFVAAGVNFNDIQDEFYRQAAPRLGLRELFSVAKQADVPIVTLSAGVKNVLDIWYQKNGLEPLLTLASEMHTDEAGRAIGWDANTVIHMLNKSEIGHPELLRLRRERPHAIALGDALQDSEMVTGDAALRIRILDRNHLKPKALREATEQSEGRFDAVIFNSLYPMQRLVGHIAVVS